VWGYEGKGAEEIVNSAFWLGGERRGQVLRTAGSPFLEKTLGNDRGSRKEKSPKGRRVGGLAPN